MQEEGERKSVVHLSAHMWAEESQRGLLKFSFPNVIERVERVKWFRLPWTNLIQEIRILAGSPRTATARRRTLDGTHVETIMASLMRRAGGTLLSRSHSALLVRTPITPAARQFTASACWRTAQSPSADNKDTRYSEGPGTSTDHVKATPDAILKKALTLVPQHGWTTTSITKAAESMGYPAIIHGMFPNGGADLIDYFLKDCLNRLPLELEGRMEGYVIRECYNRMSAMIVGR